MYKKSRLYSLLFCVLLDEKRKPKLKDTCKINGWKIDLLMDTQENNNAVNENIRGNVPYLIWSSYDRLNIKSISKFEDFFVFDDNSVEWTGSIQSLHLFKHNFHRKYSIAVREKVLMIFYMMNLILILSMLFQ